MRSDKRIRRKVRRSYMVSTVSISLVLFLLGSVGYMLSAALSTAHTLRGSITLSVELDQAMEQGAKDALGEKLSEMEGVSGVEYVSRQEKIEDEDFRRMFASEIESILADTSSFGEKVETEVSIPFCSMPVW